MNLNKRNSINNILEEKRIFPPSKEFSKKAFIKDLKELIELKEAAKKDSIKFWGDYAKSEIDWYEPFKTVLDDKNAPFFKWFPEGKLNISYNCLDRHIKNGLSDKTALIWQGEPGDDKKFTYSELLKEVCKSANGLKSIGVKRGDLVCIYMPMIPEAMFAMLACARIGAQHSVVFGGFSSESLKDRLIDGNAKFVITADGGYRKDKEIELKKAVDLALDAGANEIVEKVIVVQRIKKEIYMDASRDLWWHELLQNKDDWCEPEKMNSEDRLFILYTSGSTGKPKGVVHTTAGYNLWSHLTFKWVFDIKEDDIYWCTADIGWITGHSYIIYGPLSNGATTLMFEGVPNYPDFSRFWQIIDKHQVNIFYTAPTAIRALMREGDDHVKKTNRNSLKLLGTVGEPINPEAWKWYFEIPGNSKCPIVDTWWQTETGGILISPQTGAIELKPGSASKPFFGIEPCIVNKDGEELSGECEGMLCIKRSWPGQMRTVYGDHNRFIKTYFSQFNGKYFTGDGCKRDKDGYYWITGRVDDVIIVSGHNLGTAEIESAFVSHPSVSEAAVVGYPHDIKGSGLYCYVSLNVGVLSSEELVKDLKNTIRERIGPIATPDFIHITSGLPKTRSGKIMRRILRKIASNDFSNLGDTSTLADPSVVDDLIEKRKNI